MAEPTFILYSTTACHLCEQAESLLMQVVSPVAIAVEVIDISEDDALLQRYGTRIPVVGLTREDGSSKELDWPFDLQALQGLLGPCVQ